MNSKCKLYLDIDGVLLKKDKSLPDFIIEFLRFATENYDCYWLTTHCRSGENKANKYLSEYFPDELFKLIMDIQPAFWETLKTEAIDFNEDFFWVDDYVFTAEQDILRQKGVLERLVLVYLNNENELLRILSHLKNN